MKKIISAICIVLSASAICSPVKAGEADTYICEEYQAYIYEIADEYCVCPELIMSMVEIESSGRADVSNGSCVGLMGVSQKWHKDRMTELGVSDLNDPYSNILVGTDYLMELAAEHGDVSLVLDIYNGNSKAYELYEAGEMSAYAHKVLDRSMELEIIHGK